MSLKKILALVLVFAMCLSFVPTYAFAEDDGIELVEEVEDIVEVVDEPEEEPAAEPVEEETPAEPVEEEVPAEEPAPVEEEPAAEPEEEEEEEEEEVLVEGAIEDTETFDAITDYTFSVGKKGFEDLNEAANKATETNAPVKVQKDANAANTFVAVSVAPDKSYEIVGLNGGELLGSTEFAAGTATVTNVKFTNGVSVSGGTVTLKDVTIVGNISVSGGTLTLENVTASNGTIEVVGEAKIAIKSGTYNATLTYTVDPTTKWSITGGTFSDSGVVALLDDWYTVVPDQTAGTFTVVNEEGAEAYIPTVDDTHGQAIVEKKTYYATVAEAVEAAAEEDLIVLNPNLGGKFALTLNVGDTVNIATNGNIANPATVTTLGYYIAESDPEPANAFKGYTKNNVPVTVYTATKGAAYVAETEATYVTYKEAVLAATPTNYTVVLMSVPTPSGIKLTTDTTLKVKSNTGVASATPGNLFEQVDDLYKYVDDATCTHYITTSTDLNGVTTYSLTAKTFATGTNVDKLRYYKTFKEAVTAISSVPADAYLYALAGSESVTAATSSDLPAVTGKMLPGFTSDVYAVTNALNVIKENPDFNITHNPAGETTANMSKVLTTTTTDLAGGKSYTTYLFSDGVAKVGDTYYATLAEAGEAANGAEITLCAKASNIAEANDLIVLEKDTAYAIKLDAVSTSTKLLNVLATVTSLTTESNLPAVHAIKVDPIDEYGATIAAVDPVASITTRFDVDNNGDPIAAAEEQTYYYAIFEDAVAEFNIIDAYYEYLGISAPTIFAMANAEWTLGTPTRIERASGITTLATDAVLRISQNSTGTVTVNAPAGWAVHMEQDDRPENFWTEYRLSEIYATVDNVHYDNYADAIAAGAESGKLVTIVKATDSIVLDKDLLNKPVTIGPKAMVTTGTDKYIVTTPTAVATTTDAGKDVPGHVYYMVTEDATDGVVFTVKELVASVSYTQNKYTRTEQFDSFAAAADFIFADGTKVEGIGAGAPQASVTLFNDPAATDTWTLTTPNTLTVKKATGDKYYGVNFATATTAAVKGENIHADETTVPGEITFTVGASVAYVKDGLGNKTWFDDIDSAIAYAQSKNNKNFVVTIAKPGNYVIVNTTTNSNLDAEAVVLGAPFKYVLEDGVEATVTAYGNEALNQYNDDKETYDNIDQNTVLLETEDGAYIVVEPAAAVNLGEFEEQQLADFSTQIVYKTYNWTYFGSVEDAIKAAAGEHEVVVFTAPTAPYMLTEDEVVSVYSKNEAATFTVLGVQDVNNTKGYTVGKATMLTTSTDAGDIYKSINSPFETQAAVLVNFVSGAYHTVTLNDGYTTNTNTVPVFHGEKFGAHFPAVNRDGYELVGWFIGEDELTAETVITEDVTATAKWESTTVYEWTFHFLPANATLTSTTSTSLLTETKKISAKAGTDITAQLAAIEAMVTTPTGFTVVDGWYLGTDNNAYGEAAGTLTEMTATNTDFYKKYEGEEVTATFVLVDGNGEVSDLGAIKVKKTDVIPAAAMTALFKNYGNRYTLTGWKSGTTIDIGTETDLQVNENMTVTAKADPKPYQVKFAVQANNLKGTDTDLVLATKTVVYGGSITGVPTAAQVAEKLQGNELATGMAYDPSDLWSSPIPATVTADTTIYLKVVPGVLVTIISDDVPQWTVNVPKGSTVGANMGTFKATMTDLINAKANTGVVLDGFTDTQGQPVADTTVISRDATLVCAWSVAPANVTASWYDEDGTTLLATTTSAFNEEITVPEDPTKEGTNVKSYVFDGWKAEDNTFWTVTGTGSSRKLVNGNNNYPTVTEDVSFTAVFHEVPVNFSNVKFTYQLSLSDKISIGFHVKDLPTATDLAGYELQYTINGETTTASLDSYNDNVINVADLAAKQVVDEVTVTLKYKGQQVLDEAKVLSVKKYCDTVLAANSNQRLATLCGALLKYGYAAQQMFSYKTDTPAVSPAPTFAAMAVPDNYSNYKASASKTLSDNGITGASANVNLESKIEFFVTLKHDATAKLEDYQISVDNSDKYSEIETSDTGTGFLVKIKGIAAKDLDTDFTVSAKKGSSISSVTVSPFTYCYAKQKNPNATENAKNLAIGLYEYGTAADAYANPMN